jgi:uncharacterized protein (TIGR03437 family)
MRVHYRKVTTLLLVLAPLLAQANVTTYHNDNARTGQYLTESLLSPATVRPGRFGKRFGYLVDGNIYGQPLYVSRVNVAGQGLHDVVFVATTHDSVYAFDADSPGENAAPLWQVNFLDAASGVTAIPMADVNCPVIAPELGIVGTPVIDPAAGTLYAIAATREPGPTYVYRLHALDITSGAERAGSPVVIEATGFTALMEKQRGALLLANGVVYSEWSSSCDIAPYHGFVIAHDATTLNQLAIFNSSPQGNGASFWNGGAGPAADSDGNLFVVAANGDFDADQGGVDYGESVIKLSPNTLTMADYFTPFNQSYLDGLDLDVGSSGAVLLPDSAGNAAHPHLLFTAGKEGRMYLLDRDNLGHAQVLSDSSALASLPAFSQAAFGSAAWFNGNLYVASQNAPVDLFAIAGASLTNAPAAQSPKLSGALGAVPSISANGTQNGIVWTDTNDSALNAFDAGSLAQLYDSSLQASDYPGAYIEFTAPTVAESKVFVAGVSTVLVYGELAQAAPVVRAVANAASFESSAVAPGSLVAVFGTNLSLATAVAQSLPLPISLDDVSVTFGGLPAPLLYVSSGQINAQVPAAVPMGAVPVIVRVANGFSAAFTVQVQPAAPGIFQIGSFAAAVNLDGSVNSAATPAAAGSYVSVYLTGDGPMDSNVVDGDPSSGTVPAPSAPTVSATINGVPATVSYAGPAPGYAGLIQLNLQLPVLPAGSYPLVVTINGQATNSALLSVSGS